ncbi:anthranilate synthase component I [Anoxybacillus sp. B7M1]|jgi:para-aminobenzoate synthetase component I|uniref:anthranilate synthase component I n=1 Tax=unclassified Anoxybacillus TaxID=2639704 RepID=UPI0005CC9E67|nr:MULTISPECIES: anthranilate synthase component I [unclassified Anoxybacillus]ANB56755.1 anthranilate synthase component I [Anoxybacillus sp. B2M1]ANB64145.1 anthranilate synthase component I [Anoxybacillus sp. B7M1]
MRQRRILKKKIAYQHKDWFKQYQWLAQAEPYHILLESGRSGRYSIIGLRPAGMVQGSGQELLLRYRGEEMKLQGNPLHLLKQWFAQWKTDFDDDGPDFQGGLMGYVSYDCVRYIERLPSQAEDDLKVPDLYFLIFDDIVVYDHEEQALHLIVHYVEEEQEDAQKRLSLYEFLWLQESKQPNGWFFTPKAQSESVSMTETEFMEAVEKVRQYIGQGDVFQVNLSVRQSKPLFTHPFHIYEKLRLLNPSPYMGYLHFPEFQVVSGSPELLIKKRKSRLSTRPIAGTRSRGSTAEEDQQIANQLLENEKERAEHLMLVDLERNDLGRVCKYGTVKVDEWMTIEAYSHVMHIVSHVSGEMKKEKDVFDVIKAVFPGGTITGAPKVRTMEIIEELEPVRRGIYTGSIGWIGFNGDMEFNIAIRTMIAKDGMAHVQAGAGIVIDSRPPHEYKECLKKARALWQAKEMSEAERLFMTR